MHGPLNVKHILALNHICLVLFKQIFNSGSLLITHINNHSGTAPVTVFRNIKDYCMFTLCINPFPSRFLG